MAEKTGVIYGINGPVIYLKNELFAKVLSFIGKP